MVPIGFFEVNMPKGYVQNDDDAKIFGTDPSAVTGKIYEQLGLMQLSGPKRPIGVVTTWNKWQLISKDRFVKLLPSSPPLSVVPKVDSSDPVPFLDENNQVPLEQCAIPTAVADPTPADHVKGDTKAAVLDRNVYASHVVRAGPEVGKFLAYVFDAMLHSASHGDPILQKPLQGPTRHVVFGDSNEEMFHFEKMDAIRMASSWILAP